MIVSITDQVLMVCPTVIPKYSLTSQKPASLTCEKNSDPQPIASASSATVGLVEGGGERRHDAGRGDRGDRRRAGGDPDADRDQPAEQQRRDVGALGRVGDHVADARRRPAPA